MVLKEKDKVLIAKLFENSRKSNRILAKEIGITKETIATKINYLLTESYIRSFSLKLDYDQLGFEEYNIFLRLKNLKEVDFQKLIKYLEKNSNTTWIGKSFGKYDLKIALIIKKISTINNLVNNLSSQFGQIIDLIDVMPVVDKYKSSSKFFFRNLLNIDYNPSFKTKNITKNISFDKTDFKLISYLGENPKEKYVNLALKLNLTGEAIKYRIKQLENSGLIKGYSIVLNGNKFNRIWCLVLLNVNPQGLDSMKKYLQKQDFLSSYSQTIGVYNFNVTFFTSNIENLHQSLNDIRTKFSKEIRNLDFLIFFDIYKYPQIPSCIFEQNL